MKRDEAARHHQAPDTLEREELQDENRRLRLQLEALTEAALVIERHLMRTQGSIPYHLCCGLCTARITLIGAAEAARTPPEPARVNTHTA